MRLSYMSLACGVFLTAALIFGSPPVTARQETKVPKQVEKKLLEKTTEPEIDKIDQEILRRAGLSVNADALVEFLRKRTLPEKDRPAIEQMVRRLNASQFAVREKATQDLIKRGVAALEVLHVTRASELELKRRIENVLERIHEKDVAPETVAAAVRVLAQRRSGGAGRNPPGVSSLHGQRVGRRGDPLHADEARRCERQSSPVVGRRLDRPERRRVGPLPPRR